MKNTVLLYKNKQKSSCVLQVTKYLSCDHAPSTTHQRLAAQRVLQP